MNSLELFSSIVNILSALAIVVGMMIATVYLIKKIMKKAGGRFDDGELIKVLSTKHIGPRSSVMLIEVSGSVMVIGLSNHQISLLARVRDQQTLKRLKDIQGQAKRDSSFSDRLAFYRTRLLSLWRKEGGRF